MGLDRPWNLFHFAGPMQMKEDAILSEATHPNSRVEARQDSNLSRMPAIFESDGVLPKRLT
jgi:hypothetical protein